MTTQAPARDLALAAADAAAGLIPSAVPLRVDRTAGGRADPDAHAFVATFTGAVAGQVTIVVDDATVSALSGNQTIELADAVRPALEAAAASTGPCVLGPVQRENPSDAELVALRSGDRTTAWVGVTVSDAADIPRPRAPVGSDAQQAGLHLLRDVEMTLSVEIGRARMTVRELLGLAAGSVVELDRAAGSPADLLVNGRLIARGEVVVVDEDFGLRITEIVAAGGEAGT